MYYFSLQCGPSNYGLLGESNIFTDGFLRLHSSWVESIGAEFDQPYMLRLRDFLLKEKEDGKNIFPSFDQMFNAFELTRFDKVKVVVLGQDPYHGGGQAHGLSFSVPMGLAVPPSLRNIYKELSRSCEFNIPDHGCLLPWAEQGVLLLNATLSVERGLAGSHQGKGWESFTDAIISELNTQREGLVFLLWGAYAQKKGKFIDANRHLVLRSAHPSPLSAYRGFLGNNHFVELNRYLLEKGKAPISWAL